MRTGIRVVVALGLCLAACGGTEVDEVENACDDYCVLVMRNCQGTVAQYSDVSTCLSTCQTMEVGDPGQNAGNNIACRTYWAGISEGDSAACTRAGPGGDGTCGTNCESFCATTMALCSDQTTPPYTSVADCEASCPGLDASEVFDASDIAGNTLACRIYHMTAASTDQDTHCIHTAVQSAVCL
jgi:hypothetical protein